MSAIAEEIRNRCNIADIVGRYVSLKRQGNSFKGLCPFHNEKTPSFNVSEEKNFFYCFGCGESGDVISFLMKIENIDYITAVSKLAEEYHIDIQRYGYQDDSKKKRVYSMNTDAARFFFRNLSLSSNEGYSYLRRRDLDNDTIKTFGLGYALNNSKSLLNHLKSKGYTEDEIYSAGLISKSENGKGYYDRFRNRVIFPIINTNGKVIAFGGRNLGERGPKYLNSPETIVFSKKNNLFGLNLSRNSISKENHVILVEGYMDMVSLYKHGIYNVVASLGTALTFNQCRLLKRYTDTVILSYDADQAGHKAALRGIDVLRDSGLNGRVLHIPDGKDPDDFVKNHGKEAFLDLVSKAKPYAEYLIDNVRSKYNIAISDEKISFLNEISELLIKFTPIEADIYIDKIALEMNISKGSLRRQLVSSKNKRDDLFKKTEKGSDKNDIKFGVKRTLLSLMLFSPENIKHIVPYEEIFNEIPYLRIYNTMKSIYSENNDLDIKILMDSLESEDALFLEAIIDSIPIGDNPDVLFRDCINKLKEESINTRLAELQIILDFAEDSSEKEMIEIQNEIKRLSNERNNVRNSYGV